MIKGRPSGERQRRKRSGIGSGTEGGGFNPKISAAGNAGNASPAGASPGKRFVSFADKAEAEKLLHELRPG